MSFITSWQKSGFAASNALFFASSCSRSRSDCSSRLAGSSGRRTKDSQRL